MAPFVTRASGHTNTAVWIVSLLFLLAGETVFAITLAGRVVDAVTAEPVAGALVTVGDRVVASDRQGLVEVEWRGGEIAVRALGYHRMSVDAERFQLPLHVVALTPVTPRAVYLSAFGIGEPTIREPVFALLEEGLLNAVVIDVKDDHGHISFQSAISVAKQIGANDPLLVPTLPDMVAGLRAEGVYTIARIVVFKDDKLATGRPDLALRDQHGEIWRDREGLAWLAPYRREAWEYVIAVAVEAAVIGFDEIQFDYIRFPDERGPRYTIVNSEESRVATISGFLAAARDRLRPYNVFVSADLFGYVFWNRDDTMIGQKLEALTPLLDYLSPMLYPSGFHHGIAGYRNPVEHPYEIVYQTLRAGRQRTALPPIRFRPWLQAFRDYAFDRRAFAEEAVAAQIRAADESGSHGWMLWNPRNVYPARLFTGVHHNRREKSEAQRSLSVE